jgi:hypothetical protein
MNKEVFDNILKDINKTRKDFAELTGIKYTTVTKWNDTDRPIPPWVESWLKNYIKAKDMDKVVEAVKPHIK